MAEGARAEEIARYAKAVGAVVAGRFWQVDGVIQNLVDQSANEDSLFTLPLTLSDPESNNVEYQELDPT